MAFIQSAGYGLSLASNCNKVYNCRFGTNWSDTIGLGNNFGLMVNGSHYNDIGGTTSGEKNPLHFFNEQGEYEVCLSIFCKETGCEDTYCEIVIVELP